MAEDNRGWQGDSEGHRRAAEASHKRTNWWPLLFLPVAFVLGWWSGDASDNTENRQAAINQTQPGVGGGPDVSITPGANNGR